MDNKTRVVYADILRIIATWGVIAIHGRSYSQFEFGSRKWIEYGIIGFAFSFCVPVFLMLSGMFSLRKEHSIQTILFRKLPKVLLMSIMAIVFSAVAGVMLAIATHSPIKEYINIAVTNWRMGNSYLAVLAGCYLVTPFLYKIVENPKMEQYFLVLSIIFSWVVPSFVDLDFIHEIVPDFIMKIMYWIDYGQVYIPVGSTMFFVLGHYLDRVSHKITKKMSFFLLFSSIISWEVASFYHLIHPECHNIIAVLRYGRYYGSYVSPLITFLAVSVFLFFKIVIGEMRFSEKAERVITHIGRNSVMIFLLHGSVISIIRPRIPVFWTESFLLETVVDVTLYFIICYLLSLVLEHIPVIKSIL